MVSLRLSTLRLGTAISCQLIGRIRSKTLGMMRFNSSSFLISRRRGMWDSRLVPVRWDRGSWQRCWGWRMLRICRIFRSRLRIRLLCSESIRWIRSRVKLRICVLDCWVSRCWLMNLWVVNFSLDDIRLRMKLPCPWRRNGTLIIQSSLPFAVSINIPRPQFSPTLCFSLIFSSSCVSKDIFYLYTQVCSNIPYFHSNFYFTYRNFSRLFAWCLINANTEVTVATYLLLWTFLLGLWRTVFSTLLSTNTSHIDLYISITAVNIKLNIVAYQMTPEFQYKSPWYTLSNLTLFRHNNNHYSSKGIIIRQNHHYSI